MARVASTLTKKRRFLGSSYNCEPKFRLQSQLFACLLFFAANCYGILRRIVKALTWPLNWCFRAIKKTCKRKKVNGLSTELSCYTAYGVLIVFGYLRQVLAGLSLLKRNSSRFVDIRAARGFVPIYSGFARFYANQIFRLVGECMYQPICSKAGATVALVERFSEDHFWTFRTTGRSLDMINMGSYNYLDLNQSEGQLADEVESVIKRRGVGVASTRTELGTSDLSVQLDSLVAEFLGVESAVTFGMGFATNSSALPAIMGWDTLVLSDELNHSSIALGCKLSGAQIRPFKHNDVRDLEAKIVQGLKDKGKRPIKKIFIIVEGLYSMEGTMPPLKEIIAIKKRYKCYLYLDEAHSIGALGHTGRGVTEVLGVDRQDVDILMGTFTKSFGAAGGYVAGSRRLVDYVRRAAHGQFYATSMAMPIAAQVIAAIELIKTNEGLRRINCLESNSAYFRAQLKKAGFTILGTYGPVVPLMVKHPAKLLFAGRELRKAGVAVAIVGFPATPLSQVRLRFCLSAGHTREQIDKVIEVVTRVGRACGVDYERY